MKEQILFLFAASALCAACSSENMPTNNPGGGDDNGQTVVEEQLPSSLTVTSNEGIGMSIGALGDTKADTRATAGNVYFTLKIPDDVLKQWDSYVMEADDFAICLNGQYLDVHPMEGGAYYNKLKITRGEDLSIQAEGLDYDYTPNKEEKPEMTFECYLWIKNQNDDGTERFTYQDKLDWIGFDDIKVTVDTERGYDITADIEKKNGAVLHDKSLSGEAAPEYGYAVRYNAYRGLQGNPTLEDGETVDEQAGLGDTPYIKVSIHVNQLDDDVPTKVISVYPGKTVE